MQQKVDWNINGKTNDLILMRLARFQDLIKNQLSQASYNEMKYLIAKMVAFLEVAQQELKGTPSDAIVHAMLILVATKVEIGKKIFNKVLNKERNKKESIRIEKIKKTTCYAVLKKGLLEILKQLASRQTL